MTHSIDRRLIGNVVLLVISIVIFIFGITYEVYLYKKSDNVLVETQLQQLGYTNIDLGEKTFVFGGFYRCTREDVASFDFSAITPNGMQIENMYACVGVTMNHLFDPQVTVRYK